jgi:hypothetical protein
MFTVPSCTQFLLFFFGLLLWRSITTSAPKNPVAGCLWDGRAKQQCLPPPTWCWHILARLGTPGVVVYQCLPHQFGSTKETTKIGSSGGPRPVFWCFLYLNRLNLQPTSLKPSISAHQDIRAHDLLGGGYAMFTYTKGWFLTGGSLFSQGIPWHPMAGIPKDDPASAPLPLAGRSPVVVPTSDPPHPKSPSVHTREKSWEGQCVKDVGVSTLEGVNRAPSFL